jgi:hypothetical protein
MERLDIVKQKWFIANIPVKRQMFCCIQILITSLDLSFMKLVESGDLLDLLNKGQIFKDTYYVVVNLNNCFIGHYLILLSITRSGITHTGSWRVSIRFDIAISLYSLDLHCSLFSYLLVFPSGILLRILTCCKTESPSKQLPNLRALSL